MMDNYIYIYSLKDHTLIKKFGGRGEGPMEFMGNNINLLPYPDHIIVNSQGKITYWTKAGEFVKEVKCPFAAGVEPCGDAFVSLGFRARTDPLFKAYAVSGFTPRHTISTS